MNRIHAHLNGKVLPASVRKTETGGILWEIDGKENQPPNAHREEPRYYTHSMGTTFEVLHACLSEKEATGFCATHNGKVALETRPDGVILITRTEGITPANHIDAFIPNDDL